MADAMEWVLFKDARTMGGDCSLVERRDLDGYCEAHASTRRGPISTKSVGTASHNNAGLTQTGQRPARPMSATAVRSFQRANLADWKKTTSCDFWPPPDDDGAPAERFIAFCQAGQQSFLQLRYLLRPNLHTDF